MHTSVSERPEHETGIGRHYASSKAVADPGDRSVAGDRLAKGERARSLFRHICSPLTKASPHHVRPRDAAAPATNGSKKGWLA